MAAKKPPHSYPTFVIRRFEKLEEAYSVLRNLVRSIEDLRGEYEDAIVDHADRLDAQTGSGAPGTTPTDTNLYYLDTAAKDMYVSVGTASSADWKKITP